MQVSALRLTLSGVRRCSPVNGNVGSVSSFVQYMSVIHVHASSRWETCDEGDYSIRIARLLAWIGFHYDSAFDRGRCHVDSLGVVVYE